MCNKNILIVVTNEKPKAHNLKDEMLSFLSKRGIKTDVCMYNGTSPYNIPEKMPYTHAISLGGDGTVLFTARLCAPYNIPVLPINFGSFGFIASVEPSEWKDKLESFINGEVTLYERLLLGGQIFRNEEPLLSFEALNDIVISSLNVGTIVDIDVSFNDIPFGTYRGDGIIISTPTGSTAYSAAFGGPILDPSVLVFLLTPMAPFSLSNRPIILPSSGCITIKVPLKRNKHLYIIRDGQKLIRLRKDDILCIKKSPHKVLLAEHSLSNFYCALKNKLGWHSSCFS